MPAPGEPRLKLSGLVHRALLSFHERDQQRRRLINMLVLAQALLFVAAAPAYIGSSPATANLIVVGAELLVCVVAWVFNQFFLDAVRATYLLIVGGCLAVLAQVLLAALNGDTLQAAHASLLLLTIILDAGLLFAPDVTLIVALGAVGLTAVGLVLAMSRGPAGSSRQEYLLLVSFLGVQVVTALISWLLSGFIYDTAVEAERVQALQFAQVRLDALTTQMADQRRRQETAIATMQDAMRRALAGETSARSAVTGEEFSVLSGTLNVVLERLDALSRSSVALQGQGRNGQPLIDFVARGSDGGAGPAHRSADMSVEGLAGLSVDQDHLIRRLARVRDMAGELVVALIHSQDGLTSTAQSAAEALRTVGAVVSAADGMRTTAQQGAAVADRVLRSLNGMTGAYNQTEGGGADGSDVSHAGDAAQGTDLRGLGPDLEPLEPDIAADAGISASAEAAATSSPAAELSVEAPDESGASAQETAERTERAESSNGRQRGKNGQFLRRDDLRAQLAELSPLLTQLVDELARQEQAAGTMTHELSIVNRNARGVDVGVAWATQALEAIRRNAERLYQVTGGNASLPRTGEPVDPSLVADLPARARQPTRPLSDSNKLSPDALASLRRSEEDGAQPPDAHLAAGEDVRDSAEQPAVGVAEVQAQSLNVPPDQDGGPGVPSSSE